MLIQNISSYSNYNKIQNNFKTGNPKNISFGNKTMSSTDRPKINKIRRYISKLTNNLKPHNRTYSLKLGYDTIIVTIRNYEYIVLDKNEQEIGYMSIRQADKNEFKCDDELYKRAKKGPIVIENIVTKNNRCKNFLIREAIKESKQRDAEGGIIVKARCTDAECIDCLYCLSSAYDIDTFDYYKKGFRGIDKETEEKLQTGMNFYEATGIYGAPEEVYMYLPSENIDSFIKTSKKLNYCL